MPKKKRKSVSFDAMVKYFMQNYDIPTKSDIDRLMKRIDRLEQLILTETEHVKRSSGISPRDASQRNKSSVTATDLVLDIVKQYDGGVGFAKIQEKTGFDEKKLRNIIYRLYKLGKIKRVTRGMYISA